MVILHRKLIHDMKRAIFSFMIMVFIRFAMPAQNIADMEDRFVISSNGKEMTATFADNSSAEAFRNLIAEAPLTVEMSDYGGFEKVGPLGYSLPTNDTRITTQPGDVILYLGSNITIYYGVNTWSFTRLGRIDGNPSRESILSVLGNGSANVTFSFKNASTGMSEVSSGFPALKVHLSGRTVTVSGLPEENRLFIYNLDGKCVYQGLGRNIMLPDSGIYTIVSGKAKSKIMIK